MSLFKSLFGWLRREEGAIKTVAKQIEHNGFVITARPYLENGQYQLAGSISKETGGEVREHSFIRADRFSSLDAAVDASFAKGRQLIEEQGERLFK